MQQDNTGHPAFAVNRVADFDVVRALGSGGSFVLAKTPRRLAVHGEHAVLKVIPADAGADANSTFETITTALRAIAEIRSDFLVQLWEVGRNDGVVYCAMEHLPGGSLAAPATQLNFADVLRAISCAARGAHDLHEAGIAHRNIHPGAVVLHPHGAKLADPGLSGYLSPGMTLTGRLGQPHLAYLDPDVLRGKAPSRSSDLFSLGATLHYAASGRTLYPNLDESQPTAALSTILDNQPTVATGLPEPIERIVRQCIERTSDERPKTAGDLADRLDALWKR
ncbi:serine/threonine protein kinase [Cumulibacter soli]|uniref:serine/threonine protein kinase n=1 Tax=Cumulibacter soli TaxID=2546344 RepID=UPI00141A4D26|nr:protein kinase [Cumulibacter soli]